MSEVVLKPWRESEHTKIWRVNAHIKSAANYKSTPNEASIETWVVYAPWMAIAWSYHLVSLVHLRDLPGQTMPVKRQFAAATHELMAFAIDPGTDPDFTKEWTPVQTLSPVSIVQQFEAESDEAAQKLVESGLEVVVRGQATVESDFRGWWYTHLRKNPPPVTDGEVIGVVLPLPRPN